MLMHLIGTAREPGLGHSTGTLVGAHSTAKPATPKKKTECTKSEGDKKREKGEEKEGKSEKILTPRFSPDSPPPDSHPISQPLFVALSLS
jgi:hypothetical protein